MEFTVKRSKWARGGMHSKSLLNGKDERCCLGFFASQYGIDDSELEYEYAPRHCYGSIKPLVEIVPAHVVESYWQSFCDFINGLLNKDYVPHSSTLDGDYIFDNTLSIAAIEINDDTTIEDAEREYRLTLLFDLFGHTIKFVD